MANIDVPPTPHDARLRVRHVSDSVKYNLAHAHDHSVAIADQLGKLRQVDPNLAKKQAGMAQNELQKTLNKFKKGAKAAISARKLDQSSAEATTKGY